MYVSRSDCRAVLGTESGANVFDFDGSLSRDITDAMQENPKMTFDEAFDRFLSDREGEVVMNQVSPKIFEAIAMRTALVLFEGEYSGVVEPDKHFIPLKKDYSNVDDVLARLEDFDYLTELTDRAHRDVIESGRYSYRTFIRGFDDQAYVKGFVKDVKWQGRYPTDGRKCERITILALDEVAKGAKHAKGKITSPSVPGRWAQSSSLMNGANG